MGETHPSQAEKTAFLLIFSLSKFETFPPPKLGANMAILRHSRSCQNKRKKRRPNPGAVFIFASKSPPPVTGKVGFR